MGPGICPHVENMWYPHRVRECKGDEAEKCVHIVNATSSALRVYFTLSSRADTLSPDLQRELDRSKEILDGIGVTGLD